MIFLWTILGLLIIVVYFMGHSDWHLNRNAHNQLPEGRLKQVSENRFEDITGLVWELQPHIKNKFHQPDEAVEPPEQPYPNLDVTIDFDPDNSNLKFLAALENGASYEAILQPDGTYLTRWQKNGNL